MKNNQSSKRKIKRASLVCAFSLIIGLIMPGSAFAANVPKTAEQYIGKSKAKSIALEHAGITASDAVFIKSHLDYDDGRVVYDVEFYSADTEYDYEIDALTGEILEYDREIEHYTITKKSTAKKSTKKSANSKQYIGAAKAKSIALEHSGISASNATFIKATLDYDDGRVVYDVEFYSADTEYDYEIDALTGEILEYDQEIEYYTLTKKAAAKKSTQKSAESKQYIGTAKAKSIALSDAKLTESQVNRLKVKLDRENKTMVYEIEFSKGRVEYEYEIDAVTGKILKTDIEHDD